MHKQVVQSMAKGCQVTSLSNNALHVPWIVENVWVKKILLAVGQDFTEWM